VGGPSRSARSARLVSVVGPSDHWVRTATVTPLLPVGSALCGWSCFSS
jgi:hypothetical protein